jgi:hypothetical protein
MGSDGGQREDMELGARGPRYFPRRVTCRSIDDSGRKKGLRDSPVSSILRNDKGISRNPIVYLPLCTSHVFSS